MKKVLLLVIAILAYSFSYSQQNKKATQAHVKNTVKSVTKDYNKKNTKKAVNKTLKDLKKAGK